MDNIEIIRYICDYSELIMTKPLDIPAINWLWIMLKSLDIFAIIQS
jgi:hypothetical protein